MDDKSWDGLDPAPMEFFHAEIMKGFHDYRKETGGETVVPMNGLKLSIIIAKAKTRTHAKYPHLDLKSAIKKVEK